MAMQEDVCGHLSSGSRPVARVVLAIPGIKTLLSLTIPMLMSAFGSAAAPLSRPGAERRDAQGWNGPGWYLTTAAYPGTRSGDMPTSILFGGPYPVENGCLEVYDRLYPPVGICRFLDLKPAAFSG